MIPRSRDSDDDCGGLVFPTRARRHARGCFWRRLVQDRSSLMERRRRSCSKLSMQIIVASNTMALPLGASPPCSREGLSWFAEQDGNEEKGPVLVVDFDPRMCEVSFVGVHQCTHGCSPPRPWRSACTRPRAINIALHGCLTGVAVQRLFQPASALLSAGLGIFRAGTATQCPAEPSGRHASRVGVLVKHMELHNRRSSIHSRVRPEPRPA